ncbi:MAG TPA: hypothetical protein VJZ26_07780 [Blastocatellia bacterium]|nr:hypothetical protein [Blastocatellia bacterium]
MGKRKKLLLKIEDKFSFIKEHQDKIKSELAKPNPNEGLIDHWQSEIRGARKSVARYKRRLEALGWKV